MAARRAGHELFDQLAEFCQVPAPRFITQMGDDSRYAANREADLLVPAGVIRIWGDERLDGVCGARPPVRP